MDCGLETVACRALQHVANVHNKCALNWSSMNPSGVFCVENLQTAHGVLFQDGKEAVICVFANPDLGVEVFSWPVMQKSLRGDGICQMSVK